VSLAISETGCDGEASDFSLASLSEPVALVAAVESDVTEAADLNSCAGASEANSVGETDSSELGNSGDEDSGVEDSGDEDSCNFEASGDEAEPVVAEGSATVGGLLDVTPSVTSALSATESSLMSLLAESAAGDFGDAPRTSFFDFLGCDFGDSELALSTGESSGRPAGTSSRRFEPFLLFEDDRLSLPEFFSSSRFAVIRTSIQTGKRHKMPPKRIFPEKRFFQHNSDSTAVMRHSEFICS
jgi:hypothetical protein